LAVIDVPGVKEPSIVRVLVIPRWGTQHLLAKGFVRCPITYLLGFLLGSLKRQADLVVVLVSPPGFAFVAQAIFALMAWSNSFR
jgi:hypothetical protein